MRAARASTLPAGHPCDRRPGLSGPRVHRWHACCRPPEARFLFSEIFPIPWGVGCLYSQSGSARSAGSGNSYGSTSCGSGMGGGCSFGGDLNCPSAARWVILLACCRAAGLGRRRRLALLGVAGAGGFLGGAAITSPVFQGWTDSCDTCLTMCRNCRQKRQRRRTSRGCGDWRNSVMRTASLRSRSQISRNEKLQRSIRMTLGGAPSSITLF